MKDIVVFGLLGPTLDAGKGKSRWAKWRPTVALCQHESLPVVRFELLYQSRFAGFAESIAEDIATVSPSTRVRTTALDFGDPWDFEAVYGAMFAFARGYRFDLERERYLVHITTGTHVAQICLFLLTEALYFPASLVQSAPPSRPGEPRRGRFEIVDLDLSKYDRLGSRFRQERLEHAEVLKSGIPTRNEPYNRLVERLERVAISSRDPLLLVGPTGSGKSQLAERVYELKRSRHQVAGAFVEVNCATLRGDQAMSALFGHAKGAFTGAVRERPGLLRAADGGVLFLDEVGELGVDEQAMLLRALEKKCFLPLGADREVRSDFQLIAGTNRDLRAMVAEGRFRDDLLARIDLWTFRLPGLRERAEDVEPNLDYELERYAERTGTRVRFSQEARERFLRFATSAEALWTGNFRDLGGAVTRMATLADGGRITVASVEEEIARLAESWRGPVSGSSVVELNEDDLVARVLPPERLAALDPFDRTQLRSVLEVCRRARTLSDAGRELFSVSRDRKRTNNDADRLGKYLARFGLEWRELRKALSIIALLAMLTGGPDCSFLEDASNEIGAARRP